jgi:hypothetical protein
MRARSDRADCKIVRIETSAKDPSRKRYICACDRKGPWEADGWRHGSGGARWYTADRLLTWNWKVHAGNVAHRHVRRAREESTPNPVVVSRPAAPSPLRFDLERAVMDRLVKWLREAEDLHGFCVAHGIAPPSPLVRFVNSYETPPGRLAPDIKPGVIVEWEPEHASGTMRGVVTRIADGRVFLVIERRRPTSARRRKPEGETWFDPDEVHQLRVVPILGPHHCPALAASASVLEVSRAPESGTRVTGDSSMISVEEPPRFELGNGGFADHC